MAWIIELVESFSNSIWFRIHFARLFLLGSVNGVWSFKMGRRSCSQMEKQTKMSMAWSVEPWNEPWPETAIMRNRSNKFSKCFFAQWFSRIRRDNAIWLAKSFHVNHIEATINVVAAPNVTISFVSYRFSLSLHFEPCTASWHRYAKHCELQATASLHNMRSLTMETNRDLVNDLNDDYHRFGILQMFAFLLD